MELMSAQSTVMLAVDISFLAVPTVQNQTVAILIVYLSTLCALGSLVVSLVLAGQVNDTRRNNAEDVVSFFLLTVLYSLRSPGLVHGTHDEVWA